MEYSDNNFLHTELLAAAESQPHAGKQSRRIRADGTIVTMEEMVVRLAGLAVAAHTDRTVGLGDPKEKEKNTCFGNPVTNKPKTGDRTTAKDMCGTLYGKYREWLLERPNVPYIGDRLEDNSRSVSQDQAYNEFYDNPVKMHFSTHECDEGLADANQSFASTDKYLTVSKVDSGDGQYTAFRQQCLLQHLPSMIDQESLFGLPDFERFPMLKERTGAWTDLGADHARYDGYMDAYFYNPMEVGRLNATDVSTDVRRLHLYTIADLAVAMWWALPTLCALTFWALSAAWELPARILDVSKDDSSARTAFPPTLLRVGAWISSIASVAWIYNVHPWPLVTGPRFDPTCEDYRQWGSVYGISNMEEAAAAWHAATALLFIVVVEVVRGLFLLIMFLFSDSITGQKINITVLYGVRGVLQLGMVALGVGVLVHISNLFTRHAANLVFVLQTQQNVKLTAMEELKLGSRIASSGLMLYSVAFAVAVAAGSVALLWTLPRKQSEEGNGADSNPNAMEVTNGINFKGRWTWASLIAWALLVIVFLWPVPQFENMAAHDTDWDLNPSHNQFAGVDTAQYRTEFLPERIKGRDDDINDGHADSTFFAKDFQGYYSTFVPLVIVTLVAWFFAVAISGLVPPGYRLSADGQLGASLMAKLNPKATSSAPSDRSISVSKIPLLPLAPQPPLRRSRRVPAHPGVRL